MLLPVSQCPEFANQPTFFNQKKFRDDLASSPPLTVFKNAITGVNTHFDRRFDEGEDIRYLVYERAIFIDLMLHYAWHQFAWDTHVCLIAVGGYGRIELHPQSDIDILILLSGEPSSACKSYIQQFITFLWDIGLNVGSSVRTLAECDKIAKDDVTVVTNLMEARTIAGNNDLQNRLKLQIEPSRMWSVSDFYEAKVQEQHGRHKKHNYTEYNLEPNVKNSPGGLRDIQTIKWVAKRYYDVQTLQQLQGKNFFTEREFGLLRQCEAFLWQVRYGLHRMTGRAEERLLFEYQRELAEQFGFKGNEQRLAVERFMHEYYRCVLALRELNDVLLSVMDEKIHRSEQRNNIIALTDEFQLRDNYIEVTHRKVFEKNPSALLEIFLLLGENPDIKGARSNTIRLVRENCGLVDEAFRNNPVNRALFLRLFKIKTGLVTQLRRMTRYGILGRYLPAFGQIVGQMQHDLFHRYTVDAHTLLVIENIRRFLMDKSTLESDTVVNVMQKIERPELLYIAALFHDIAKGRGGDHSELGAVDAAEFCDQHGLTRRESRLVSWLVKNHLLMSQVSQKKDISEPEVIHDFALRMGDLTHLNYLFALTVADMCGTNPDIWNSWRASLMHQLYSETKLALRRGLENTIDQQDVVTETKNRMTTLLAQQVPMDLAQPVWQDMRDDYFLREGFEDIAWQTEAIVKHQSDQPLILIRDSNQQPWQGATQIFIRVHDTEHVFLAAASALAQLGLNIQDARLYNTKSGLTVDTFYVLDENFKRFGNDKKRHESIRAALLSELHLVDSYSDIVRRRTPRQLKQFTTPTRTRIHSDIIAMSTLLEVISPDRPGLLATIGRIFMDFDIQLQNAKISTLGERVEDIFFITDQNNAPLSNPDLCQKLQTTICQQLDQQVEKDF